jgi:thiol-disulfide isomerase/thioredoxin
VRFVADGDTIRAMTAARWATLRWARWSPALALWLAALCTAPIARGQSPAPATPADTAVAKPSPPSPVSGIRNKISAGDLLSAESILEVYAQRAGEDSRFLNGLAWLARGALLLGDPAKAERYAGDVRRRIGLKLAAGTKLADDEDLETALGGAIEVQAQLTQRRKGAVAAADGVRKEIAALPDAPVPLRARLHKRLDMLSLVGTPAPEIDVEDWVGERPPSLASLRGRPVLLFVWAEGCGDCRGQSATLAKVKARHLGDGLEVYALSRYYDPPEKHAAEKARADSVWKAFYADVGTIPRALSTASMIRYGGSSTPTFVFIDRAGVVRDYTPTRLTDPEFERRLALILGPTQARARK